MNTEWILVSNQEADQLIKEQGLILAMTDDEEYAREEVTKFIGRWN